MRFLLLLLRPRSSFEYPQLAILAWHLSTTPVISEEDALALYEHGWRHVDTEAFTQAERDFVQHLADTYSGGLLLS